MGLFDFLKKKDEVKAPGQLISGKKRLWYSNRSKVSGRQNDYQRKRNYP